MAVAGEDRTGAVADVLRGGARPVEEFPRGLFVTEVELSDREVGQRPLHGVVHAGPGRDVDRLLEYA